MIEINLVPDVKLEMLKAQKMRNVAISLSIFVGIGAGVVVTVLAGILGTQVTIEKFTNDTIKKEYAKLASVNGINDTLTLQNQLKIIPELNANKTLDSRALDVVAAINPAAPNDMKFSKITLDPKEHKLTIEGSAIGGFAATEVFRKTILNTTVEGKKQGNSESISVPLTDEVTLQDTSFGKDSDGVTVLSFTIVFLYPDELFSNTLKEVSIKTPTSKIDVTDSKTRVPDSLFSEPVIKETN